jgi:hypothetical protein
VAAFLASVVLHAALFWKNPALEIDAPRAMSIAALPRLVLIADNLSSPAVAAALEVSDLVYVPADSLDFRLGATNLRQLSARLARVYPKLLWFFEEESSARFEVLVDARGRVTRAELLELDNSAALGALTRLATELTFLAPRYRDQPTGALGIVELRIERP